MSEPSPVRVWFGWTLMAFGGLSGLCTGVFTGFSVVVDIAALSHAPASSPADLLNFLALPLELGGVPLGLGGGAFMTGRIVGEAPVRRWLGRTALAVGLLIVAASAYPATMVTLHGPRRPPHYEIIVDPLSDPFAAAPLIAGLVLVAAAIYELRRKTSPGVA